MKKPYRDLRLKQRSPEWSTFRLNGIGGSEIASVMAMASPDLAELVYTSPLKLFLHKLEEPIQAFTGNLHTFEGQYQERAIIDRFKYYDLDQPDAVLMHKNIQDNIRCNDVRQHNGVFQNPKYEWLFYSPDSLFIKDKQRYGILEGKLTTSMETKRYTNKINPSHYLQVMQGLMITGLSVGYILYLIDGQWYEPIKVEPDTQVFKWIEETSADFWLRVVKARKLKIEYELPAYFGVNPVALTERQREGAALIAQLEPNLLGSTHELDFIKGMIAPQAEIIAREGTQDEWEAALGYLKAGEEEKTAEAKKKKHYAEMLRTLNGSNTINFMDGKSGFYSYKPDKNGKTSLYVSPKIIMQ